MDSTTSLAGNLTRDPELRYTPNGTAQTVLGVACSRLRTDRATGQRTEETSFFDVVCWSDLAENVAESLHKGDRVAVIGRLQQRTWQDKDTGANRYKVEVVADEVAPSLRWATAKVVRNVRTSPADASAA